LYVVTFTRVDSPLLGMIDASAYPPPDGVDDDEELDDVVVDAFVLVVVLVLVVVVEVVVEEPLDPPITVAIGAHQPANASPQVTAALPVPVDLLWPPELVDRIEPDPLTVAHRRTNPVV
jgi:hypothetical protein